MPAPRSIVRGLALLAVFGAASGTFAVAASDEGATVSTPAEREASPVGDVAAVFDIGTVDRFVAEAADRAVRSVGGAAAPGRTGSLGMRRITRDGVTVHAPPDGYLAPMVYMALPRAAIGGVMGDDIPPLLDHDSVVMHELTAGLTGAQVGDVVVMQAADGSPVPLEVAGIRPAEQIGWGELVFIDVVAARLGATEDTRVVLWGFDDRGALDAALAREGVLGRRDTRVVHSWDPPSPDSILSTAETKVALGEPWYRFRADGSVAMHPAWTDANLTDGRVLLSGSIPIRARCHVAIVDDLRAALDAVAAAGLAGAIDVGNANTYGGCYGGARFSRLGGQIGFLSRHTYGMALDTNTASNCLGCRPAMHCDVVRIFRRHGFAWGGNFRRPDGMHFEWVGERRDQMAYPSTYCPNRVEPLAETAPPEPMGRAVLTLGGEAFGPHEH